MTESHKIIFENRERNHRLNWWVYSKLEIEISKGKSTEMPYQDHDAEGFFAFTIVPFYSKLFYAR